MRVYPISNLRLSLAVITAVAGCGFMMLGAVDQTAAQKVDDKTPDIAKSTIVNFDRTAVIQAVTQAKDQRLQIKHFSLSDDLTVNLNLARFSITSRDTQFVLGSTGNKLRNFDPSSVTLLRGDVSEIPGSHVFIAVSENSAAGYIDLAAGKRFQVTSKSSSIAQLNNHQVLVFEATAGIGPLLGVEACGLDTSNIKQSFPEGSPISGITNSPTQTIELAIETDYEYYSLFNDVDLAAEYIVQLYGAVSDIYLRDANARFELTFVRIWDTEDDLFNEDNPLFPFRDYWNANMDFVQRDVAQFLTGRRNLPYGGVAWLSALCGSLGYSVAGYALGSFVDPNGSSTGNWDLIVTAHELGHNCGTLHTHSYKIDSCNVGDLQRGTIMSYCHTTEGGNANIDLRFHEFIKPIIYDYVSNEQCTINDCNGNYIDDAIDISDGDSIDSNLNGIPDECEDCNENGQLDDEDIASGFSDDLNGNSIPDECEPDCNNNGIPDDLDILNKTSQDLYGDGVPDECQADCNGNQIADYNEIQLDMSLDIDRNVVLDSCQDCDNDGINDLDALGGAHNLWAASLDSNRLSQCHSATGVVAELSDAGQVSSPQDLVVRSSDKHVLVTSATDNRVVEFDAQGNYLGDFVAAGDGGLSMPTGLTFASNGNLLVASFNTNNVLEYDGKTGSFVGEFVAMGDGGLIGPFGMTFGPKGNLFLASSINQILEFEGQTGNFVRVLIAFPDNGGLNDPKGLLFKDDGNLLVTSYGSDQILEYDGQSGAFLGQWNHGGNDNGFWGLNGPWGITIGPDGNVYVASHFGNAAIHMYQMSTGAFMRSFYVLAVEALVNPTGLGFVPGDDIDCNFNLIPDSCDITSGYSLDANSNGIPDECEPPNPGDLNGDGVVNTSDLLILFSSWGPCAECKLPGDCPADLDGDCSVSTNDLLLLFANWG